MSDLHDMMRAINTHHFEANPDTPTEAYLRENSLARDILVAKLKKQGKRVLLVKGSGYESCGRYVCEGDDGFNGYSPLPGTVTTEEEV